MENSLQRNLQFFIFKKTDTAPVSYTPNYLNLYIGHCVPYFNFVVYTTPPLHFHTQFHRKCPSNSYIV